MLNRYRNFRFMIAFGVWDIFYYLFLRIICGWPKTIWDWDILFLLPLPWWGPVLAPVSIALLLIVAGLLLSLFDTERTPIWPRRLPQVAGAMGSTIALIVFMADAILVARMGTEAVRQVLPRPLPLVLVPGGADFNDGSAFRYGSPNKPNARPDESQASGGAGWAWITWTPWERRA